MKQTLFFFITGLFLIGCTSTEDRKTGLEPRALIKSQIILKDFGLEKNGLHHIIVNDTLEVLLYCDRHSSTMIRIK